MKSLNLAYNQLNGTALKNLLQIVNEQDKFPKQVLSVIAAAANTGVSNSNIAGATAGTNQSDKKGETAKAAKNAATAAAASASDSKLTNSLVKSGSSSSINMLGSSAVIGGGTAPLQSANNNNNNANNNSNASPGQSNTAPGEGDHSNSSEKVSQLALVPIPSSGLWRIELQGNLFDRKLQFNDRPENNSSLFEEKFYRELVASKQNAENDLQDWQSLKRILSAKSQINPKLLPSSLVNKHDTNSTTSDGNSSNTNTAANIGKFGADLDPIQEDKEVKKPPTASNKKK